MKEPKATEEEEVEDKKIEGGGRERWGWNWKWNLKQTGSRPKRVLQFHSERSKPDGVSGQQGGGGEVNIDRNV